MRGEIPYFGQTRDVDCGVGCLQMSLGAFGVDDTLGRQLAASLPTDPLRGTCVDDLAQHASRYLHTDVHHAVPEAPMDGVASLIQLVAGLQTGAVVIVNYLTPDDPPIHGVPHDKLFWEGEWVEGHLAVVCDVQRDPSGSSLGRIVLRDPLHGPQYTLSLEEFIRRWRAQNDGYLHWMLMLYGLRNPFQRWSAKCLNSGPVYRP